MLLTHHNDHKEYNFISFIRLIVETMRDIIKLNWEIIQAHQVSVSWTFRCSYAGLSTSVRM